MTCDNCHQCSGRCVQISVFVLYSCGIFIIHSIIYCHMQFIGNENLRSQAPSNNAHYVCVKKNRVLQVKVIRPCFYLSIYLFIYLFIRDSAINIENIWCVAQCADATLVPGRAFQRRKEETVQYKQYKPHQNTSKQRSVFPKAQYDLLFHPQPKDNQFNGIKEETCQKIFTF